MLKLHILIVAITFGCAGPAPEPAEAKAPAQTMTPKQEAEAWCAMKLYGPGMADWCEH